MRSERGELRCRIGGKGQPAHIPVDNFGGKQMPYLPPISILGIWPSKLRQLSPKLYRQTDLFFAKVVLLMAKKNHPSRRYGMVRMFWWHAQAMLTYRMKMKHFVVLLFSWHSLLFTLALVTAASDWTPLGDEFLDSRRFYLSQEGSRVARYYTNRTSEAAVLQVYEYSDDNQQWTLVGEPLEFEAGGFNFRVSGDGNRLLCSKRGEFVRVYGYSAQDNQWKQVGQDILPRDILPPTDDPADADFQARRFPSSLAISYNGTRIVVSWAPEVSWLGSAISFNETFGIGRVWIYEYDNTFGRWKILGEALNDETSPWFGPNVKMSGDGSRVAIGQGKAIQNDQGEYQISLTWRVYQSGTTLSSPWESIGAESLGAYGILDSAALSIDGSVIALGTTCAEFDLFVLDVCVGQVGKAHVVQYNNGSWTQLGQELIGQASGDGYGVVSLSGDGTRLAVGGDGDALEFTAESVLGRVRTFVWDPISRTWVQDAELLGDQARDTFGERVSLSLDGSRLGVEAGNYARVYGRTLPTPTLPMPSPVDDPTMTGLPTVPPTGPPSAVMSSRVVLALITGVLFAFCSA